MHHDTVRRALTLERVSGTGVKSVRPTLLDDYKDFIQATLVLPSTLDEGKEGQNERAG